MQKVERKHFVHKNAKLVKCFITLIITRPDREKPHLPESEHRSTKILKQTQLETPETTFHLRYVN